VVGVFGGAAAVLSFDWIGWVVVWVVLCADFILGLLVGLCSGTVGELTLFFVSM